MKLLLFFLHYYLFVLSIHRKERKVFGNINIVRLYSLMLELSERKIKYVLYVFNMKLYSHKLP